MALPKKRRILRVVLGLILVLIVLLAALPLWFPWILKPYAAKAGLAYRRFERRGYQRFELVDVVLTNHSGRFEAREVEAFIPTVWLGRAVAGDASRAFLDVRSWTWKIRSSNRTGSSGTGIQTVENRMINLRRWVPQAELSDGRIFVGRQWFLIPSANWSNGRLSGMVSLGKSGPSCVVEAVLQSEAESELKIKSAALELQAALRLSKAGEKFGLQGAAYWFGNRIELNARFPLRGFLPEHARVRSAGFSLPASLFKLPAYRNLEGTLRADWSTNRFELDLAAQADPRNATNLPPIAVEIRGSGDTNSVQVDRARISVPWLSAAVSSPTRVLFHPPFLTRPSTLELTADLSKQSWLKATGELAGRALLRPNPERFPRVSFAFAGSNLMASKISARTLDLDGELLWPLARLHRMEAVKSDGSHLAVSGDYNLESHAVTNGRLHADGGFGKEFLPQGYSFKSAAVSARFAGPLGALTHSAQVSLDDVILPHTRPLRVRASWAARGRNIDQMELTMAAGASSLRLAGSADLAGNQFHLQTLQFSQNHQERMRLQQPANLSFRKTASPPARWILDIQPFACAGPGLQWRVAANVRWPGQGSFQIAARELDPALLRDFVTNRIPEAKIAALEWTGGWTNGPLLFHLAAAVAVNAREKLPFQVNAIVNARPDGISLGQLSISSTTQEVCRVNGWLPATLELATQKFLRIDPAAPIRIQAVTQTNSLIWEKIAEATGLSLRDPRLTADVSGTWMEPRGRIGLQVQRVQFSGSKRPWPVGEQLDVAAELDREAVRLTRLGVVIEGQPILLTAQMPLGKTFWADLARTPRWPDWHRATVRLQIAKARLSPFAAFLPKFLSPEGYARADISLMPPGELAGGLTLFQVKTWPIPDVGPVQNIAGQIVMMGRTVVLTNLSGEIGGQTVIVTGSLGLDERIWQSKGLPLFDVRLQGTNVPLLRKTDLLLRTDLDLTVTNPVSEPPLISGSLRLRDSLYLADLQNLAPGKVASPRRRPPYFSIETEPWAAWRVQVEAKGDGFMRVQTPVFSGKVSAVLKLSGTLKDPIALGDLKIDSGAVTFPFGTLDVKQGFVSLTSANPYRPQLFITATAPRFGYDVRMEATGPADAPVIEFSSTPPLSSEQIVSMLTTGQIPLGSGATTTTQQRAQGFALFLGRNLLSEVGLGGGGPERLTIRSGEQVSESGRPTYEATYKLNDKWSLVGEYDRFDQYDLNLKWRVYSK